MQPLARDGLSAARVASLLAAPATALSFGCEVLNPSTLAVVADRSADLLKFTVERENLATIHQSAQIELASTLAWGYDLLRLYCSVSDGSVSARFSLGVYSMVSPKQQFGKDPTVSQVQGYDRVYLLNRELGRSYEVAGGTSVLGAVRQAFADAGLSGILLDGSASAAAVPKATTFPLVSGSAPTWLGVINNLLRMVNYRGIYADENGLFRSEPYARPVTRPVEWDFVADVNATILDRTQELAQDLWNTPNRWIFLQSNRPDASPAPSEGDGVYTYNNYDVGLSSQASRFPPVWPETVEYDVATQDALVSLGDRRVASDLRASALWTLKTGWLPTAGHFDVATLEVGGAKRKMQARGWKLDSGSRKMEWVWEELIL